MKKEKESESTALQTTGSNYLALKGGIHDITEAISANLGTGQISEFMLDSLRIPAGGAQVWQVPGLEEVSAKTVEGVIVAVHTARAFWRLGIEDGEGNSPPDCSSTDGIRGQGDPGGACMSCSFNQWGSAQKGGEPGKGKACKEMRVLFLLREESRMPLRVVAPPSSLGPIGKYLLRLTDKAIPYWGCVTRLGLSKEKSKGAGIAYSAIAPEFVRRLEPSETDAARAYAEAMAPLFASAARVDYTDTRGEEV